ncbi:MAG: response regulator [Pedosphaera sp.]|nr:response regulator [Pedosphaera sp.]
MPAILRWLQVTPKHNSHREWQMNAGSVAENDSLLKQGEQEYLTLNMSKLNQFSILYVDDEFLALKYFEKGFSGDFTIFTASSAAEGWAIIEEHHAEIGVVLSDQKMPGQSGVELLARVRERYPHIIRILVTAYSDVESAVAGVNEGAIYRYISKPWDVADLRVNLLRALQFFELLTERDQLLREKLSVLQQIVLSDRTKNLGVLAAGLQSRFRNALRAATAFVGAVPQASLEPPVHGSGQSGIGKTLEQRIFQSGKHVSRIASAMAELAEAASNVSPDPLSLQLLLSSLDKNPSLAASSVVSLRIDPAIPPLKVNPKQMLRLFTILTSNLLAVAENNSPITIEARETTDERGVNMIRILLSDGLPGWTSEQRVRFFAPFSSIVEAGDSLGLDLAVCFFIVHHHGGRIVVGGKQKAKITIDIPVDPTHSIGDPFDPGLLDKLFHYERTFEDFVTRQKPTVTAA